MVSTKSLIILLTSLGVILTSSKTNYQPNKIKNAPQYIQTSPKKEKITIAQAKTDPAKRQAYLDQLVANTTIPYCNGIIYDNDGNKILEHTHQDLITQNVDAKTIDFILNTRKQQMQEHPYLAITPHSYFTRRKNEPGKIFFGPDIFKREAYQNDADFKATIAHETRHLLQHAKGLPFDYLLGKDLKEQFASGNISMEDFEMVGELDAYFTVLEEIKNGKYLVSQQYAAIITNQYNSLRKNIEQHLTTTNTTLNKIFLTTALNKLKM